MGKDERSATYGTSRCTMRAPTTQTTPYGPPDPSQCVRLIIWPLQVGFRCIQSARIRLSNSAGSYGLPMIRVAGACRVCEEIITLCFMLHTFISRLRTNSGWLFLKVNKVGKIVSNLAQTLQRNKDKRRKESDCRQW